MKTQIFRKIRFLLVIGLGLVVPLGLSLGCSSSDHSTGGGAAVSEESLFSAPSDDLSQAENDLVASGDTEQSAALSDFPAETP